MSGIRHCTSHFKRTVCISCRLRVDVRKAEGESGPCGRMWTGRGGQKPDFRRRHKWLTPLHSPLLRPITTEDGTLQPILSPFYSCDTTRTCRPSSPITTIAPRCLLGLTFPDF